MRVAIFHNYIDAIGGGEKLALMMARILKADVITTDVDQKVIQLMGFGDVNIISLGKTIKFPPLKQISASLRFALCDFSQKYDFFIFSGDWAIFASKKHQPNFYYCHTPTRAFYDLYSTVLSRLGIWKKVFFFVWVKFHELLSRFYLRFVNKIVCNSKTVRARIKKYLKQDAKIVYPFVTLMEDWNSVEGDFWLSVNRLYPEKRIELQIEVFRALPEERLVIVGGYAKGDHAKKYVNTLMRNLPPNIEMLGVVSEDILKRLYLECKAFIATALDEDFGFTPLEAMAAGKPVVAVNEGGYKETVIDGVTGRLVYANRDVIIQAIKEVGNRLSVYHARCRQQAEKFNVSKFKKQIRDEIWI